MTMRVSGPFPSGRSRGISGSPGPLGLAGSGFLGLFGGGVPGEELPHHLVRDVLGRLADVPGHHRLAARPGMAAALDAAEPDRRAFGALVVDLAGDFAPLVKRPVLLRTAVDLQPGLQELLHRGERMFGAGALLVPASL